MSDDEDENQHDLIGDDDSDRDSVRAPADDDDDGDGDGGAAEPEEESATLYVFYNRQYYKLWGGKTDKPGFLRCYNRIVKVPNGKALGAMVAGSEGWPTGEELFKRVTADKIVVLSGKMKEDDTDLKNVWYVLVEVEGQTDKQDHLIARHIPKKVYMEIADHIKQDPNMATSSLLTMLAHDNNSKPINPGINGFEKITGDAAPKSGMVGPEKKQGEKKPEKSAAAGEKKGDAKKKIGDSKKPAAAAPTDDLPDSNASNVSAPSAEIKDKKVSASSFFKPKAPATVNPPSPSGGGGLPTEEGNEPKDKKDKKDKKDGNDLPLASVAHPPSSKRKSSSDDAMIAAPDGKETAFKRTRIRTEETFEFLVCDPSQRLVDIPVPLGCTGGEIKVVFRFN